MFDLKNTEKYKSKDERRLKTATVLVAAVTIGFYIVFILLMVITKFGILSAFIHTKPVVNSITISEDSFYDYLNFDFYYKRFNWLYNGDQDKMFFVYSFDLNEEDNNSDLSKIGWKNMDIHLEEDKIIITSNGTSREYDLRNLNLDIKNFQDIKYFTYDIQNYSSKLNTVTIKDSDILNMLATKNPYFNIPNGITIFFIFGLFMLISALMKIISIAKSNHNGKLEFSYGSLGVKIVCILETVGILALTYVFFWVCLWKIPIFYNVTEPSMVYYFRFMLPVIFLNALYAFLYNKAADMEQD